MERIEKQRKISLNRRSELPGQRFGKLTVRAPGPVTGVVRRTFWLCDCDCGTKDHSVRESVLLSKKSLSCGCLKGQRMSSHTPEVSALLDRWSTSKVWRFYQYSAAAKRRNHCFELSHTQFEIITSKDCFYCGEPPRNVARVSRGSKYRNSEFKYNGIDRVDNTKGYTYDNSVPCCKQCNFAKRNLSQEDFLGWVERLYSFQKAKRTPTPTSAIL